MQPLILTLKLDAVSHRFFTQQRTRLFPPSINFLEAHVTLFHHLPGALFSGIAARLILLTSTQSPFPVEVTGLRNLGKGVAYALQSPQLLALRDQLAQTWSAWLAPQDRQKFNAHVTVQNKVTPELARETLAVLQSAFVKRTIQAIGLDLWRYEGGPWSHLQTFDFK